MGQSNGSIHFDPPFMRERIWKSSGLNRIRVHWPSPNKFANHSSLDRSGPVDSFWPFFF